MNILKRFGLPALLALLAALQPALARTSVSAGVACAPLIQACNGDEASCVAPLLQGLTAKLPAVAAADIAGCNAARSLVKIPEPPAQIVDGSPARGAGPQAAPAWTGGKTHPPNIVLILADDFSMNLMSQDQDILSQTMPNLARMIRDGVTFHHYFVTDSLCCPSRTTIFTGLLPHNSGVFTNSKPDGGFFAFQANDDASKTFAVTLQRAGYATAMMGKYLNGYMPQKDGVPIGWSEWDVAGNGYANFNYVLNENGVLRLPGPHLTDEISILGRKFIAANADRPFFLELATFSPHGPCVPPVRYNNAFADIRYPQGPAYDARPDASAPAWLKAIPPLTDKEKATMFATFQRRLQSDKGIDDMIGALRAQLVSLGIADNTYVIFTSDNGLHMGEYSLRSGKLTPFDTDIRVPLVVVGPQIAPGRGVDPLAGNLDLAPTFAAIAKAPKLASTDGRSLLPWLTGTDPGAWRSSLLVEHHQVKGASDNPDAAEKNGGDPPTYAALRTEAGLYVEYVTGEVSYYDLTLDPDAQINIAANLTKDQLAGFHAALAANTACHGPGVCWAAQSSALPQASPQRHWPP